MPVVIGSGLVLSGAVIGDDENGDNPVVGYQNLVTAGNITADTEDANHPAVNLANPATHLFWRGAGLTSSPTGDDHITVVVNTTDDVDYVGIAKHNLFSGLIPVSIEGQATGSGDPWVELVADVILPNDGPALFRFTPQSLYAVRIRLQSSFAGTQVEPQIAVVYVGKLLVLQRRIYVGHTPINYGRSNKIINGRSESGNFLGRIVLGEMLQTKVDLSNLTASWYRIYMDPFIAAAVELPFFFAWRPFTYPFEVGYGWITDEPQPSNQRSNGMMQISFSMTGVT